MIVGCFRRKDGMTVWMEKSDETGICKTYLAEQRMYLIDDPRVSHAVGPARKTEIREFAGPYGEADATADFMYRATPPEPVEGLPDTAHGNRHLRSVPRQNG